MHSFSIPLVKIAGRIIGPEHPPFIVAEMSGNHNQSLERALAIVDAAADSGAHALKLQTYTADTMTLPVREPSFSIGSDLPLWSNKHLYDLYKEAYTPWEWHEPIMERCRKRGLICFSSPFDASAVDFLEQLDVPCYKIASFENTDLPLIRKVAALRKPIIMSTGMASLSELSESVSAAREAGCRDLILLKCTSAYPASPSDANLAVIPYLAHVFSCNAGLSDHTMGIGVPVAAVALGATVIEKHFTLRRADGGVDSSFSMEPPELESLVRETERAWQAIGKLTFECSPGEINSRRYRRSIFVVADLNAGDVLTENNIRILRPADGLEPKYLNLVLGKRLRRDASRGTPLKWDLLVD